MRRFTSPMRIVTWLQFSLLFASTDLLAQTPFSLDSASTYLRTIAVDIGPRTMGSPNERRAMEFAVNKFREFGLREAHIMTIKEFPGRRDSPPSNTNSGVAVGVLPGKTDRTIVLGAHIDSSEPEVPGANDDGSGCAVVLELARVLSQRKNESTFVFALFGGEERGLQGSRYFVEHFAALDKVALMVQVDMANGSDWLLPLVDAESLSAPEWLVTASYEEFGKLGYSGLSFPSHFLTLMGAMPGGGIGSDHEPFLEKNIPAIDFTSDPADPIHTPQDNYENFKPSGLKRSGDLVYKLVERFDGGVPEEKTGQYYLFQIGQSPFFIPRWAVRVFILLSLAATIIALVKVRLRRPVIDRAARPKIPGLKLFLLMLIIQTCVWLSENVVSLIKGVRHPWMADLGGYLVLGFVSGCIGIWISLQLAPKLRLRRDSYSYFLRSVIFLLVPFVLFSLQSYKLALYPATALLLLSLASLVRQPLFKLIFWLLSPLFMFRLFFSEGFGFLTRALYSSPEITPSVSAGLLLGYIIFFSLWSFPFLLGFASIFFDSQADLLWLRGFRRRWGILGAGLAFVITVVVLSTQPSYTQYWRPGMWVEQRYDVDSTSGRLSVRSSEYLANTRLRFGSIDTTIQSLTSQFTDNRLLTPQEAWISAERGVEATAADSGTTFTMLIKLHAKYRPYTLRLTYSVGKHHIRDVATPLASSSSDNSLTIQWYSFPDTLLLIPLQFTVIGTDSVIERIEATFVEEPTHVKFENENGAYVVRRATISKQTIVKQES